MKEIDTNNDGVISKKELDDALKIISKSKKEFKRLKYILILKILIYINYGIR